MHFSFTFEWLLSAEICSVREVRSGASAVGVLYYCLIFTRKRAFYFLDGL